MTSPKLARLAGTPWSPTKSSLLFFPCFSFITPFFFCLVLFFDSSFITSFISSTPRFFLRLRALPSTPVPLLVLSSLPLPGRRCVNFALPGCWFVLNFLRLRPCYPSLLAPAGSYGGQRCPEARARSNHHRTAKKKADHGCPQRGQPPSPYPPEEGAVLAVWFKEPNSGAGR